MTNQVYADRVQETTTTTGTGTYSLGGAATGYQAFSAALSNGQTAYYTATDGTNWEVGIGTYATSGDTLARTTILASSNSNSAVSWAAGTKNIWLDFPAAEVINATGTGNLVRATSPTLVTPALGTPASGNLSNCTNAPVGIMSPYSVGSIVLMYTTSNVGAGSTLAASSLQVYAITVNNSNLGVAAGTSGVTGDSISGTWMAMQTLTAGNDTKNLGLFQRTA